MTLTAFNQAAIDNPHTEPIRLLKIEFDGLTLYLCDRVWGVPGQESVFDGQLYEPLILSWSDIRTGRIDPITGRVEPSEMEIVIDNSTPIGGSDRFTALFLSYGPHYAVITESLIFAGATATADRIDRFKGRIEDPRDMAANRVTLICSGIELDIANKFTHTILAADNYPGADPDDLGKMIPVIYGPPKRVPCLSVDAGGKTTIAQDMTETSPGNGGTLDVSDASALPSSGAFTIQVDSEQIRIASRSGNVLTLAASGARGYDSTTAVAHDKGAPMAEIQTAYVYLVADHPVKSIDAVYVDDIRQITGFTAYTGQTGSEYTGYEGKAVVVFNVLPLYKKQINIVADSSGLDTADAGHAHTQGVEQIEWGFDAAVLLQSTVANPSSNIIDGDFSTYVRFSNLNAELRLDKIISESYSGPPTSYRLCMRCGTIDVGVTIRLLFDGKSLNATSANSSTTMRSTWYSVWSGSDTWAEWMNLTATVKQTVGNNYGNIYEAWIEVIYTPAANTANADVSISGSVTLTGNSTAETVIGKLIAADVQGQPDDATGTYTGTANALIELPNHILRHILLSRCGLSGVIHATSYATAGTWYAENSFRLGVPILQPPNVRSLINSIARQARSLEFWEAGEHHLVHIPDSFIEDELSVLHLPMNGTDGSTSFTDDGVTGHTVTAYGNAQIDTAYFKFPTGSGLFGRGDYLSIPDHVNFYMASGRAAIDVWKRFQSADQTAVLYSQFVDNTHFVKLVVHYDIISFHCRNGGEIFNISRVYTGGFTAGTQYHFALIRGWNNNDNTWAITVNGQIVGDVYSNSAAWPDLAAEILIGKTGDWSKIADPSVLPPSTGNGTAFNHDGSLMAVAHWNSPYITIYNTSDWSKVSNPSVLPPNTGYGVAFNHDGSLMAVAHASSPYITIYNTGDWSKVANPSVLPPITSNGVAFNHDGSLMAVAHASSPYITIYNTGDWSKIADPSTLPAGNGWGVAFSHDGSLMAVVHSTSPFVTIYNTSNWSKVTNPSVLPAGECYGVAFNHDGSLMAVASLISPYIIIYNTGDWSKVTDPSVLPDGAGRGVAFNRDGSLMAVAHYNTPYTTIYNTGDWSKIADPSTLPAGTGRGAAFNHDGSLMAVAHSTSPHVTTYVPVQYSKGHKDEYRVSKATARWTADFTPSDKPYPNKDPGGGVTANFSVEKSIEANRIDQGWPLLKYTNRINIQNSLSARYARAWSGHIDELESDRALVKASDSDSIAKYGILTGSQRVYPYIIDQAQAQMVLDQEVKDLADARVIVEFDDGLFLVDLIRSNLITFTFNPGDALDRMLLGIVESDSQAFRIIDKIYRPGGAIQLQVVYFETGIPAAPTYEDFTAYIEQDYNSHIAVDKLTITFQNLDWNEDAWVRKDFGIDFFSGNFTHQVIVKATGSIPTTGYPMASIWSISNIVDDFLAIESASGDFLNVILYYDMDGTTVSLALRECDSGSLYQVTYAIEEDVEYYLTVHRDESIGTFGTLYCDVYSDPERTELITTLSLALHTSKKNFRHLLALNSYNGGYSNIPISGVVSHLKIVT